MMERPERYDPEDLEHLMLERSFDELLAEERAYALRHLEGRAEYERMRALLHHVREDKRDHAAMDADPAVRERVLAAFREQRQPQWRIWLNSVGGLLLPARPTMYWRPALALGTVAVLVFASLMAWHAMEPEENKVLAELKQEVAVPAPAEPAFKAEEAQPATSVNGKEISPASNAVMSTLNWDKQAEEADSRQDQASTGATAKGSRTTSTARPPQADAPGAMVDQRSENRFAERRENENDVTNNADRLRAAKATNSSARPINPTEIAEEAEVAGTYAAVASEKKKDATMASYSEDDLLSLLRAAW